MCFTVADAADAGCVDAFFGEELGDGLSALLAEQLVVAGGASCVGVAFDSEASDLGVFVHDGDDFAEQREALCLDGGVSGLEVDLSAEVDAVFGDLDGGGFQDQFYGCVEFRSDVGDLRGLEVPLGDCCNSVASWLHFYSCGDAFEATLGLAIDGPFGAVDGDSVGVQDADHELSWEDDIHGDVESVWFSAGDLESCVGGDEAFGADRDVVSTGDYGDGVVGLLGAIDGDAEGLAEWDQAMGVDGSDGDFGWVWTAVAVFVSVDVFWGLWAVVSAVDDAVLVCVDPGGWFVGDRQECSQRWGSHAVGQSRAQAIADDQVLVSWAEPASEHGLHRAALDVRCRAVCKVSSHLKGDAELLA